MMASEIRRLKDTIEDMQKDFDEIGSNVTANAFEMCKAEIREAIEKASESTTALVKAIAQETSIATARTQAHSGAMEVSINTIESRLQSIVSDISGGGESEVFPHTTPVPFAIIDNGAQYWFAHQYDWLCATAQAYSGIDIGNAEPYRTLQDQVAAAARANNDQPTTATEEKKRKGAPTNPEETDTTEMDCAISAMSDSDREYATDAEANDMLGAVARASAKVRQTRKQSASATWQPPFSPHDETSLAATEANSLSTATKASAPSTAATLKKSPTPTSRAAKEAVAGAGK